MKAEKINFPDKIALLSSNIEDKNAYYLTAGNINTLKNTINTIIDDINDISMPDLSLYVPISAFNDYASKYLDITFETYWHEISGISYK